MHKHTKPTPCNHKFKFCSECDVVYCEECREEWGKHNFNPLIDHHMGGPVPMPSIGDPFPQWAIKETGCMWDGVPEGKAMMMVCPCSKCNTITI